ncbi:hypothetical protein [Streptomyces inhibens]|uniref:hypothetical protein n=1 Tax=Streptomyces inhibens TaxID=2293571 RepID=UPI001EE6F9CC|nr:hypothetical protein [Streptomyces inhibens]UKY48542.1 hypothetical protein KI385_06850 [Streptomyces inhibens]
MIAVAGRTDLTAQTLKLLQDELVGRVKRLAPPGAIVVVRAGRGLPLAAGRTARKAGVPVVAVMPAQESVPAPLPQQDRAAAGELLFLATHVRLLTYAPADRAACLVADERLIASCATLLAVWDGSPAGDLDPTAHLVAYARSRGVSTDVLWAPKYTRRSTIPAPGKSS